MDFKKYCVPRSGTDKAGPTANLVLESKPFQGNSEYKRQYMQHEMEKRQLVHLEPELPGTRKSRPGSAPPGAHARQRSSASGRRTPGGTRAK
mmetsp:Transcript_8594/g.11268  ORF Transcript_8594/g.11268 Transcript_8594/m.11268 type:complete len:92 (+) Transcript_8594:1-276(+)